MTLTARAQLLVQPVRMFAMSVKTRAPQRAERKVRANGQAPHDPLFEQSKTKADEAELGSASSGQPA
ncbi:hypothetical protein HMPREF3162_03545 [Brevibacterium sp. HMSC07C04]|nr:hypothetical protein HMPREF3162_03545 [Brevibacterium sp. HMSC07C04]